jgi:hypothetical protein
MARTATIGEDEFNAFLREHKEEVEARYRELTCTLAARMLSSWHNLETR